MPNALIFMSVTSMYNRLCVSPPLHLQQGPSSSKAFKLLLALLHHSPQLLLLAVKMILMSCSMHHFHAHGYNVLPV